MEFTCTFSLQKIYITNIYAPCSDDGRVEFTQWLNSLDSSEYELWMIMGDFNLIRSQSDRNIPGGNVNNMIDKGIDNRACQLSTPEAC
jgi:hypothetical protein